MDKARAIAELEMHKNYYKRYAKDLNTIVSQVSKIAKDDLPLWINCPDDFIREMILARLREEDIFDSSEFVRDSLIIFCDQIENSTMTDMDLGDLYEYFLSIEDGDHAIEALSWVLNTDNVALVDH